MNPEIKGELINIYKERLKYFRKQAGLKQAELAEMVGVGVHYIADLERGIKLPSSKLYINISVCLNVPAYLFFQENGDALYYTNRRMYDKIHSFDMTQKIRCRKILETLINPIIIYGEN